MLSNDGFRIMDDGALRCGIVPVCGKDDVLAPRKWFFGQAFMRFPAHDHRVTHGLVLESAKISGNMPWQAVLLADDHGSRGIPCASNNELNHAEMGEGFPSLSLIRH